MSNSVLTIWPTSRKFHRFNSPINFSNSSLVTSVERFGRSGPDRGYERNGPDTPPVSLSQRCPSMAGEGFYGKEGGPSPAPWCRQELLAALTASPPQSTPCRLLRDPDKGPTRRDPPPPKHQNERKGSELSSLPSFWEPRFRTLLLFP